MAPPLSAGGAAPTSGGTVWRLQLAALSNEAAVPQAWTTLRGEYPQVLSPVGFSVERAQTSGGTMFRLQAGPFPGRDAATAACDAIRSGGGQCFVVAVSR